MSRNRVKNSQSLHWMGVVKWVVIARPAGSFLGLSYMINKNQNHASGRRGQLSPAHHELKSIEKRNSAALTYELDSMKSPDAPAGAEAWCKCARLAGAASAIMGQMVVRMDQNVRMRSWPACTRMPHGAIDYSEPSPGWLRRPVAITTS